MKDLNPSPGSHLAMLATLSQWERVRSFRYRGYFLL